MARLHATPSAEGSVVAEGSVAGDSLSDSAVYEDATHHSTSRREKLKHLGRSIKTAPKRTLRRMDLMHSSDSEMDADGHSVDVITDNPSFNTGKVFRKPKEGKLETAAHHLNQAAKAVLHPRQTAKEKTAEGMKPVHHPFLTQEGNEELLAAHEELDSINRAGSTGDVSLDMMNKQADEVTRLEDHRDHLRNAWITSRHVKRVRVARPGQVKYPQPEEYRQIDAYGHFVRFQWERWIGHLLLWAADDFGCPYVDETDDPAFKRGDLLKVAERCFQATIHWQTWLMHCRQVYMWEDPWMTARWLLTYFFLLKTGLIATFFYLLIAYIVVRNRYFPTATTELKWSKERIEDESMHAMNLQELITRHGNDQWLDPLLDELGPLIQQQLGDLADFLEILMNFYTWKNQRATWNSVIFWCTCAFVSACTSTGFGKSIVFWVVGIYFFVCRPVASRYPRYRHLVSIFRWVHWDIPTHAELAFQNLQQDVLEKRMAENARKADDKQTAEDFELPTESHDQAPHVPVVHVEDTDSIPDSGVVIEKAPRPDDSSSLDEDHWTHHIKPEENRILSFRGRVDKRLGRLAITETGIRFEATGPRSGLQLDGKREVLFSHSYEELVELRKCKSLFVTKSEKARHALVSTAPEGMVMNFTSGKEVRVEEMMKRDECFNVIIGYSGLRWQSLQALQEDEEGNTEDSKDGKGRKIFKGKKSAADELSKLW